MRTALVTGGAVGIGAAMVKKLVADGWQVAFSYRNSQAQARQLAEDTGALAFQADMLEQAQAKALVDTAITALGHIDALVLNAGIALWGLCQDLSQAEWDQVNNTNLRGAFFAAQATIPHLVGRQSGSLLFVSSIWGQRGAACEAAYAASKAGLIGLGQSLAQELGPSGIRVNCLAPGVIDTRMLDGFTAEELAALSARTCLGRIGKADEVAKVAAFLLGKGASYITGQTILVDGGFV